MKKKETEFLTEEEAQAILRVPDRRSLQGKRDYAIILTLLTTGLRKAEICNLKVGDLKTYRNQVVIDVIGKGQKFRRIPEIAFGVTSSYVSNYSFDRSFQLCL